MAAAEQDLPLAFAVTTAAGLSTCLGSAIVFVPKFYNPSLLAVSLAFSAGVMLYVSFIEIFVKGLVEFENHFDAAHGVDVAAVSKADYAAPDAAYHWATITFFAGILITYVLDHIVHGMYDKYGDPAGSVDMTRVHKRGRHAEAEAEAEHHEHHEHSGEAGAAAGAGAAAADVLSVEVRGSGDGVELSPALAPAPRSAGAERGAGAGAGAEARSASPSAASDSPRAVVVGGVSVGVPHRDEAAGAADDAAPAHPQDVNLRVAEGVVSAVIMAAEDDVASTDESAPDDSKPARAERGAAGGAAGSGKDLAAAAALADGFGVGGPADGAGANGIGGIGAAAARDPSAIRANLVRMALITGTAVALHNFPEGLATFVATAYDPAVGASIGIAIAVHNIPEGICVAVPIYFATGSKWRAFMWGTLSGVAEPIAGAVGWIVLAQGGSDINSLTYAILFGLVAGMMIYIAVKELLPTARQYDPKDKVCTNSVFVGCAVMALSLMLFRL